MITPSISAGLAQLQALSEFIDQGPSSSTIVFYDDAKPADTTIAANASAKLVSLSMTKPCLKQVKANSIELQPTAISLITKSGTAVWARLYNGNGLAVMDFDCVADMNLDTTSLIAGGSFYLDAIELFVS